jgi:hypothetical protein
MGQRSRRLRERRSRTLLAGRLVTPVLDPAKIPQILNVMCLRHLLSAFVMAVVCVYAGVAQTTRVKVFGAKFSRTQAILPSVEFAKFNILWSRKVESTLGTRVDWTQGSRIDVEAGEGGSRWLHHPDGYLRLLTEVKPRPARHQEQKSSMLCFAGRGTRVDERRTEQWKHNKPLEFALLAHQTGSGAVWFRVRSTAALGG